MTFCALSRSGLSTVNERSVAGTPLPWLMFCTIMSTLTLASPMRLEDARRHARFVGHGHQRHLGLVLVE